MIVENIERNDIMSLCGMTVFPDGIVAFADSKATKRNELNFPIEDEHRHPQKIIQNQDIIIVTTGNNYIIDEDSHELVKIEDVLQNIIDSYTKKVLASIDDVIDKIMHVCRQSINLNNSFRYSFVIGAKENLRQYYIQDVQISKTSVCRGQKIYGTPEIYIACFIGDESYTEPIGKFKWEKNFSKEKYASVIPTVINNLIIINDNILSYNPVGGNIHVEIFQ